MKRCFRSRRFWTWAAGLAAAPFCLWVAFLACFPTEAARKCIETKLGEASGRQVVLGNVRVGFFGGVRLTDLRIGAADSLEDPWLRVGEASINVGLTRLWRGRVEPTSIKARDVFLRVLRREDGTLDLADMLQPVPATGPLDESGDDEPDSAPGLRVLVHDATIHLADAASGTDLRFTEVEAKAIWRGKAARVESLTGTVNGGSIDLAALVDRSGSEPSFEGQIRLREVGLDGCAGPLRYMIPLLAGVEPDGLEGSLNMDLYLQGRGSDRDSLARSLAGQGRIVLDPACLSGSSLAGKLGGLLDPEGKRRACSASSDVKIQGGRVASENLRLEIPPGSCSLAGWTSFDGRMAYRLKTDGLAEKLPGEVRDLLEELGVATDELADLSILGSVDDPRVEIAGVPALDGLSGRGGRETSRERLRQISRALKDRVLR